MSRGFTLIELLVVIVVIGGMAGIGLMTFPGAQKSARDGTRVSELRQYQTSLETYSNRNSGFYPYYATATAICPTLYTTLGLAGTCVDDPVGTQHYNFISAGGGGAGTPTATSYVLWTSLERSDSGSPQYWVVCSNGSVGKINQSAWTPSATCPTLTP